MSLTAKVGAFWFDKSLTQISLAKREGVSIVHSVALAWGRLRPQSARTAGLSPARSSSLTLRPLSGDRVPRLTQHSFAIRKGLRPIPPSLVSRSKFPGKVSDWPSLYRMPIPGSGGGIHGQGTEKMAASVPILWLEVQQDIFIRSWRGGCCFDHTERELPTNFATCLAQPSLPSHQPVNTTCLCSNKLSLSCAQTYKGPRCHLPQVQTQTPGV